MALEVIVPQMGESVLEGTVVEWKVKEGDRVTKDQPLVELATDKVNVEIPAEISGVIGKLFASPGQVVRVGAKVALILADGESAASAVSTSHAPDAKKAGASAPSAIGFGASSVTTSVAPKVSAPSVSSSSNGRPTTGARGSGKMAPAIKRLVREYGVDADQIAPTGPEGRVTEQDVMEYVAGRSKMGSAPAVTSSAPMPAAPASTAPKATAATFAAPATGERERREKLTGSRKAIAEHMVRSKHTSPHVTTFEDCDFTNLFEFREKHKADLKAKYGVNVTYMPFIIKAACVALKEFPLINASMTDDEVIYKFYYNIGVAVGRDAGLIVPVILDADKKSIVELATEIVTLSNNANANRLNPANLQGGTFTITNAGMFGATASTPIISQPQVCILGVHNVRKMPWVVNDEILIRQISTFGMSFDHRLVDGHVAVQFLHRVCGLLEDPALLLVNVR